MRHSGRTLRASLAALLRRLAALVARVASGEPSRRSARGGAATLVLLPTRDVLELVRGSAALEGRATPDAELVALEPERLPFADFGSRDEAARFRALPPIAATSVLAADWDALAEQLAREA